MKTNVMLVCIVGLFMSLYANVLAQTVDSGRLTNLSVRSQTGGGSDTLIVGLTIGGGDTTLLLRGAGPTLSSLGIINPLADPFLKFFDPSGRMLDSNDDWEVQPGWPGSSYRIAINSVSYSSGAFLFLPGSRDSALYVTPSNGNYTMHITSADTSKVAQGVAIAEMYLVTDPANIKTGHLRNMSARSKVGTGQNVLIMGFTVSNTKPTRFLIRGIGPSLGAFGVEGLLADPAITLRNGKGEIFNAAGVFVPNDATTVTNDNWSSSQTVIDAGSQVAAFPLAPNSKDAAVVVSLPAGSYTATISGIANTTGVALAEVYLLP